MGFRKTLKKLNDYFARLEAGKARKIKPKHVRKVIAKLTAKRVAIVQELASTSKASKKDRLARKLLIAEEHLKRAQWLAKRLELPETK